MAAALDWIQRSDWSQRAPQFGDLQVLQAGGGAVVAMAFAPSAGTEDAAPAPLWQAWRRLAAHRNVLEVVSDGWLRYAALDWRHPPLVLDSDAAATRLATWGATLSWVGQHVLRVVPGNRLGWLASPIVKFDLEGALRVAFATPDRREPRCAPELIERWPFCDERGLIFALARALLDLVAGAPPPDSPLGQVLQRCLERDPDRRIATCQELRDALRLAGGHRVRPPASRPSRMTWQLLEEGIGYLALGQPTPALRLFDTALALDPHSEHAGALHDTAIVRGADLGAAGGRCRLRWATAAPAATALEQAQDPARALALYQRVHAEPDQLAALHTALARCHLQLGRLGEAVDHARCALREAPADLEANRIAVDGLWRTDRIAEALDAADAWLAAAPDAAPAHHARGKALLRLRRPLEARQALDRACLLGPALVEAMVLRREAARALAEVRDAVGTAAARTLELPVRLAELRDLIAAGRLADAIRVLQRAEHAADPDALLVLGHLLAFGARFAEALDAFEAAARCGAGHVARLARASALLELDRPGLALAAFDDVLAERPDLGEAREGRALALHRLGRDAEAEHAFRRHLAAIAHGAELRVGSAAR